MAAAWWATCNYVLESQTYYFFPTYVYGRFNVLVESIKSYLLRHAQSEDELGT